MEERTQSQERWLRFFNAVVYNSLAPFYDSMDWLTFGAWWRLVRRALDYVPPGGRVLEIGFGPGKLHVELARRADLCIGLDLARGMCRFTQRRLRRAGLDSRITRGSVYTLPYPTGAFDAVVSTFAFSGFPDGADAMREMARVTSPGGRVVLIDIGLPGDGNRLGRFLAHLWERMGDFLYDQPAVMQEAGLQVAVYEEFGPGSHIRAVVGENP
jgi:ubiquinone/menaquinone biosynthesis C-methylase UbiE